MHHKARLITALLGSVLLSACLVPVQSAPRGEPKLPDIVPWPHSLKGNYVSVEGGRRLLRFSAGLVNVGSGPVEVYGSRRSRSGMMKAYQVLYRNRNRRHSRVKIGEFEFHRDHGHWHVLQIAEYRLWNSSGQLAASSKKVSFCLIDELLQHPSMQGAPARAKYRCSRSPRMKKLRQGLSIGWSDVYSSDLADQWIDITDVPPGSYTLETEVNPDGIILEQTRENNKISLPVTL